VIAVEELEQLADKAVVVFAPDGPDARRRALLDVRVQARAPEAVVAIELGLRARADRERPQQEVERLPDGVRVREGPVVANALPLGAPHEPSPAAIPRRA